MTQHPRLEIACFSLEAAELIAASKIRVDRIELCSNYAADGLTLFRTKDISSHTNEIRSRIRALVSKQWCTFMMRETAGAFVTDNEEVANMETSYGSFRECWDTDEVSMEPGLVYGFLTPGVEDKKVLEGCGSFFGAEQQKNRTFHRAFDRVHNQKEALEDLIKEGFAGVLSAGRSTGNAVDNLDQLAHLKTLADGRIDIIAAGEIRASNARRVLATGVDWIHSSAITCDGSDMPDLEEVQRLRSILDAWASPG